jgi:hypothetical protein
MCADYTKATNFASKDSLSSGNSLKIVKGTEIDTEFNSIATAIATKADLSGPTFTGTPTLPTGTIATTQSSGNNTTAIATTAFVQAAIALLYPVGSIYTNATSSTNPGTLLGFGTWTAFGAGRVMVGFNSSNALFDTAEETGGSADAITVSHTHTATSTDSGHTHTLAFSAGSTMTGLGSTGASGWQGTNTGVNYITVSGTNSSTANITTTVASAGSSGTNANYQPYITVYMWKRTA